MEARLQSTTELYELSLYPSCTPTVPLLYPSCTKTKMTRRRENKNEEEEEEKQ